MVAALHVRAVLAAGGAGEGRAL